MLILYQIYHQNHSRFLVDNKSIFLIQYAKSEITTIIFTTYLLCYFLKYKNILLSIGNEKIT